ncbi:ABC transporter substrate-binding protein [Sediminivirga luteola]|uniref:Branched-chain amino acid ABC transporter substrate-binding protein n=1 Tax=Sediminivirga luteola TaxID=1774748 RepID=A0A8J2TVS6_9MICO|nr:ABC transporter substrate-binding protein [Sediminivirga luteola]MCI2265293.1 ABC transporter substrate-binding protein [Sediminivirga luteola]GGA04577.1 branched-chain amino acid ABC transporter substrate-binding protein [Sediminivirga luteola]
MSHTTKQRRRGSSATRTTGLLKAGSLAAVTALALAACGGGGGGGAAEGDGPIPIGVIADLSGATGDVGTPYNQGMLAYVDWINSAGGVEGREIQAISNDYAYEIPQAEELYRRYLNEDVVAVQGWGTGDTEALRTRVANDELPFISGSFSEELADPAESPYNFLIAPTYSDQMRVALNYIEEEGGAGSEVAVLHHDSPFGASPVADGQEWVDSGEVDLGYQSYAMPTGTSNFVGILSQAQSQGAEYIVIQNVASPASQVAHDIAAQNLDMKIVCLNWCANDLFITGAGDAGEGSVLVQPFAPVSADKPGHADMRAYLEEQGEDPDSKGSAWVQGWLAMHIMVEGIRHTLEQGNDLTGPNIRESLETMGPIDTGGVIGAGIVEFSPETHAGIHSSGVYEVQDGQMVEIAEGAEP